jgi:hypothetical protein
MAGWVGFHRRKSYLEIQDGFLMVSIKGSVAPRSLARSALVGGSKLGEEPLMV